MSDLTVDEIPVIKIKRKSIKNLCEIEMRQFPLGFFRCQTHKIIAGDIGYGDSCPLYDRSTSTYRFIDNNVRMS